jgi:conjugal transfer pilus assembly protein TraV
MTTAPKLFLMAAFAVALQGCANVLTPLGENHYDCNRKENPASPYCHSFKSVETATNGELPQSRFDQAMTVSDHDKLTGIAPVATDVAATVASGGGAVVVSSSQGEGHPPANAPAARALVKSSGVGVAPKSLEGLPVRVGPVVQRVWVKRFVDENDLLVSETVIYKEIIGSHWLGYDGSAPGANATGQHGGVYPHRAPQPLASTLGKPLDNPGNSRKPAPRPARSGFVQPGTRAPESNGVVSAPATEVSPSESGATSLPQ